MQNEKSVVWNENIKYNNCRWADFGASEMSALIRVTIMLQSIYELHSINTYFNQIL